jgi:hypothetical protein
LDRALRGSHSNTNDIVSLYRTTESWSIAWPNPPESPPIPGVGNLPADPPIGVPNQHRFPNFLSPDAQLSKDIQVNPKYAVRLSVSSFNLTNHFNPEALHSNAAGRFPPAAICHRDTARAIKSVTKISKYPCPSLSATYSHFTPSYPPALRLSPATLKSDTGLRHGVPPRSRRPNTFLPGLEALHLRWY